MRPPRAISTSTVARASVAHFVARRFLPLMVASVFLACASRPSTQAADAGGTGGAGGATTIENAEATWLKAIGVGATQRQKVCARGATDPVALALCRSPALNGLDDLYRALGLVQPKTERLVATATHSVGLSARTVSAVNPRTFVFRAYSSLSPETIVAVAFARGETLVELVGFDPAARDFNFYLLAFQPTCAARAGGCSPSDLLTARVERDWSDWTLYGDVDLEDTPLDCLSCHRPEGTGTSKRLLMRQMTSPWMHWGDFRGVTGPVFCKDANGGDITADGTVPSDGLDVLARIAEAEGGADARHAAIPIAELAAAQGGYDLASFIFYAAGEADGAGDVPCQPPTCPFSEPRVFDSSAVICDRFVQGAGDVADGAWARYRADALSRGLPAPYHGPDILDPTKRIEATSDFQAYLDRNAQAEPFTIASALISDEAQRAIGFVPTESDAAPAILRHMCIRCHANTTDARLARARFNVETPDAWTTEMRRQIIERLALPETSPRIMPPRRVGTLPPWAIERVSQYVQAYPKL